MCPGGLVLAMFLLLVFGLCLSPRVSEHCRGCLCVQICVEQAQGLHCRWVETWCGERLGVEPLHGGPGGECKGQDLPGSHPDLLLSCDSALHSGG